MNTIEKKQKLWAKIKPQIIEEIGNKYEITVEGLDKYDIYFHPIIKLSECEYLRCQCDLGREHYYGVYLHPSLKPNMVSENRIELHTNSLKEAIKIINRKKLSVSVKQTLHEISLIESDINHLRELVRLKTELLNSIVVRS